MVAIEPDPSLARYLSETNAGRPLRVIPGMFEHAALEDGEFDLVAAATSFHWVDPETGLAKVGRVVRPGGWVALWWTIFGDASRPDPFREAVQPLIDEAVPRRRTAPSPAPPAAKSRPATGERRPMFELDMERRQKDLREQAGLDDVEGELIRWTSRMDSGQLRGLYGSTIHILRLEQAVRARLLDDIERVATEEFGGTVERPFVTSIYTGRRPQ